MTPSVLAIGRLTVGWSTIYTTASWMTEMARLLAAHPNVAGVWHQADALAAEQGGAATNPAA